MPYQLSWLVENRVMLIAYEGILTKFDLSRYLDESLAMRDQANVALGEGGPLVHTITDARRMTKSEMTIKDGQEIIKTLRKQRVGWSIYVAHSRLDMFLAGLGHQFAGVRSRSFTTVNEGIDFLKSVDDTLTSLQPIKDDTLSRSLPKK